MKNILSLLTIGYVMFIEGIFGHRIRWAHHGKNVAHKRKGFARTEVDNLPDFGGDTINSTTLKKPKTPPPKPDDKSLKHDEQGAGDIDVLTHEGDPGWMENLLEKAMEEIAAQKPKAKRKHKGQTFKDAESTTNENEIFPDKAFNDLNDAFEEIGPEAKGAKNGLKKLKNQWEKLGEFGDRSVYVAALQSAAGQISKFKDAASNPGAAVLAAIDMVSSFASLAGPMGEIASMGLAFVSGFLSLFGVGSQKTKTVGEIVREVIDKALTEHEERELLLEAQGILGMFDRSKSYVDSIAQKGVTLTVDQALVLKANVPLWSGLTVMAKLTIAIRDILKENNKDKANRAFKYIELLSKLSIYKDVIMQETAALMPDELDINRQALLKVQADLRISQKNLLGFLYEASLSSHIMPYYDAATYPTTDSFSTVLLKLPNYDRSLAGVWCLTPYIAGESPIPTKFDSFFYLLTQNGQPYLTLGNDGCFWKLIPHADNLYTVQNVKNCPSDSHCGKYLKVFHGTQLRAGIDPSADLWEILGANQKSIRTKAGCSAQEDFCNNQLRPDYEFTGWDNEPDDMFEITMQLTNQNVGYIWFLTKNPIG